MYLSKYIKDHFLALLLNVLMLSFAFGVLFPQGGMAAETDWQGNDKSQLRLIAAPAVWQGKAHIFAGIEIKLAPEWKTYWRTPGDTGIPPYFDWTGSENLKKAEVLYPAPVRFKDPGGSSIGYKRSVILPVVLVPRDPSQPVRLKLDANYAICHDLCVPVEAQHTLLIKRDDGVDNAPLIEMALGDVPSPRQSLIDDFGVEKVALQQVSGVKFLEFNLKVPAEAEGLELFIEGPDGLYVPTPQLVSDRAPIQGAVTYAVDLSKVDDAQMVTKAALICTLKVKRRAIVQPCPLR